MAEWSELVLDGTSKLEAFKVLLGSRSHAMGDRLGAARAGSLVQGPDVLHALLTMRSNQALVVSDFDGQGVKVVTETLSTEGTLELIHSHVLATLEVLEHVLLECIEILLSISLAHVVPGVLLGTVFDMAQVELSGVGAFESVVAWRDQVSTCCFPIEKNKAGTTNPPAGSYGKSEEVSQGTL